MITQTLIAVVAFLYGNPNNLKEPLIQERNVCTTQAIYECEVVSWWMHQWTPQEYADWYGKGIREQWAKMGDVAKYATRKGIANVRPMWDKKKFLKYLQNDKLGIITTNNYYLQDKYFVVQSPVKTRGHAMCAVWSIEIWNNTWIVARNTRGWDYGIMGYNLVDINAVSEMFTFKNR